MKRKSNIYIRTYEIGVKHLENGITYNKVLKMLKDEGYEIEGEFELYYHNWFYNNFFVNHITSHLKRTRKGYESDHSELNHFNDKKGILTAEAYQNYIDYTELKEARQSSRKAMIVAIIAIIITLLTSIASICISI